MRILISLVKLFFFSLEWAIQITPLISMAFFDENCRMEEERESYMDISLWR